MMIAAMIDPVYVFANVTSSHIHSSKIQSPPSIGKALKQLYKRLILRADDNTAKARLDAEIVFHFLQKTDKLPRFSRTSNIGTTHWPSYGINKYNIETLPASTLSIYMELFQPEKVLKQ